MTGQSHQSTTTANLDLAPIGNGRIAALVNTSGRIVWWCFPRLDSDPVFSRLLAGDEEKGFCDVVLQGQTTARAQYVRNTAIVETILEDASGNAVRITDFAPRFLRFERAFHPAQIVRRIEPLRGLPRITIRLRPTFNYGQPAELPGDRLQPHALRRRRRRAARHHRCAALLHRARDAVRADPARDADPRPRRAAGSLGRRRGARVPGAHAQLLAHLGARPRHSARLAVGHHPRRHHAEAVPLRGDGRHHRRAIPPRSPRRRARSAIGTIASAGCATPTSSSARSIGSAPRRRWKPTSTTSPPSPSTSRRRCSRSTASSTISRSKSASPPISAASAAWDRCASAIRPPSRRSTTPTAASSSARRTCSSTSACRAWAIAVLFRRLEPLGHQARRLYLEPDAGPWEYRGRQRIHTHSATMCWVACDRLARLAGLLSLDERAGYWRAHADKIRNEILERAWSAKWGALAGALDHDDLDASALLVAELGLLSATRRALSQHRATSSARS